MKMEQHFNDIDHLFKEELGGYTEAPPPAVWDALEKRLKGEDKRRVVPFRWWWYVSIIAFIGLLGSAVVWRMSRGIGGNTQMASTAAIPQPAATATTAPKADNTSALATNTTKADEETGQKHSRHARHHAHHTTAQNRSAQPQDDRYANTDDDRHTANVNSNTQHKPTPQNNTEYKHRNTAARKHNNVNTTESETDETELENSYASVTHTAKAVTSSHIDIDLNDNAVDEVPASRPHTMSHTRPVQERLYASTSGNLGKHVRPVNTEATHSATPAAAIPVAKTNVAKHSAPTPQHAATNTTATAKTIDPGDLGKQPAVAANTPAKHTARKHHSTAQPHETVAGTTTSTHITTPASTQSVKSDKAQTGTVLASSMPKSTQHASTPAKGQSPKTQTTVVANTAAKTAPTHNTDTKQSTSATTAAKEEKTATANPAEPASSTAKARSHGAPKADKPATQDNSIKTASAGALAVASATTTTTQKSSPAKDPGAKADHNNVGESQNAAAQSVAGVTHNIRRYKTKKTEASTDNGAKAAAKTDVAKSTNKPAKSVTKTHPADANPVATTIGVAKKTSKAPKQPLNTFASSTSSNASPKTQKTTHDVAAKTNTSKTTGAPSQADDKDASATSTTPVKKAAATKQAEVMQPTASADKKEHNDAKKGSRNTKGSGTKNNTTAPQPVYTFASSFQKFTPADETVIVDNLKVNSFVDKQPLTAGNSSSSAGSEMGTFKKDDGNNSQASSANSGAAVDDSASAHHKFKRTFEYGVKGGVETAFNAYGANKMVISPYLQYNLSSKFSILTQPSVKVSNVAQHHVGANKTYNDTSKSTFNETDSGALYTVVFVGGNAVTLQQTLRKFDVRYDSIVKSYYTGGTYTEVELPLMLKYNIGKGLSVYGGANCIYSRYSTITEHTNDYTATYRTLTIGPASGTYSGPNLAKLSLPGTPITQYAGPLYPEQKGGLLRLGYMLGFSYEYRKRYMIDVLMQQAAAKSHIEAGVNTNEPFSLPYFRFTIGYKLSK